MSYNRFLELLLRKKSGELSAAEQQELNGFLSNNPNYHELSGMVDQLYETPLKEIKEVDKTYLRKKWNALKQKTTGLPSKSNTPKLQKAGRVKYFYVAAASVAAVLLVGVFYFLNLSEISAKDVVVTTKMGSRTSMKLPDGSTVWLNAGSEISYGEDFGKSGRDVKLSGEAYFDVTHDADHPFVVHTDNFNIKVLGTAFNVKAYATDNESEATLVRGLIELSINNGDSRKITLKPNEKLIFKNTGIDNQKADNSKQGALPGKDTKPEIKITGLQTPFKDSVAVETQWLNDCLAFRDYKFRDIALMISRWYGVAVEIKDESLLEKEFSGLFKDESVEQVMHALKLAGGFTYTISKNKITIEPSGQQ